MTRNPRTRAGPASLAAFTPLELMIALAIASVLAFYAVPSWHVQLMRTHRVDAAAAVYRAAQFVAGSAAAGIGNDATALPPGLDQAPQSGTPVYRLRVLPSTETNGGYTIEAEPAVSGPMRTDPCGTFTLDGTGLRGNRRVDGDTVASVGECWRIR